MNLLLLRCLSLTLALGAPIAAAAEPDPAGHAGPTLSSIIIYTPDMQRLAKFYEQALELPEPATTLDVHIGYWLGAHYIGFEPAEAVAPAASGVSAWFNVDDIERSYKRLLELGAKPNMQPEVQSWGDIHAAVLDPDGNVLGLIQTAPAR